MIGFKALNDDQNYEVVANRISTNTGALKKGEVLRGSTIKAIIRWPFPLRYTLNPFLKETNKPLTDVIEKKLTVKEQKLKDVKELAVKYNCNHLHHLAMTIQYQIDRGM